MMMPNQVKGFTFPSAGRGAYRSQEVDEFQRRVYAAYSELYSENVALKKKFASLSTLVDEYNEGKNSIATAIIKSQSLSDRMVEDAKAQASQIVAQAAAKAEEEANEKQEQADAYVREKTSAADAYLSRAEAELKRVTQDAEKEAERFTKSVNEKAAQIIELANQQAAKIVAASYNDAKLAQEKCSKIINQANEELSQVKAEIASLKAQMKRFVSAIEPAIDSINVPDVIDFEPAPTATLGNEPAFTPDVQVPEFKLSPIPGQDEADKSASDEAQEVFELADQEQEPSYDDIDVASIFDSFDSLRDTDESDVGEDETQEPSIFTKGYNGNNTSFGKPSGSGFDSTDFDEE